MIPGRLRSQHDPRTLRMAHLKGLPTPPARYSAATVAPWPVLGNDKEPCCTCAAAAHMIHYWTAAHNNPLILDEHQVLAAFVVVSAGSRDGAEMLQVLRFWRKTGFGERRLHSFVMLDPHDTDELKTAISLFGAAYIGLNFPDFAVKDDASIAIDWALPAHMTDPASAPNSANGHCVAAVGYDEERLRVVSCGVERTMTWEFYRTYNDEAYAVLSPEWYGAEKRSPSGYHLGSLEREITKLREWHAGATASAPSPRLDIAASGAN